MVRPSAAAPNTAVNTLAGSAVASRAYSMIKRPIPPFKPVEISATTTPITAPDVPNVRAGAHEDINFITLLVGASAAGLEVLSRQGEWVPFTAEGDTIVVNIGDMLQRLTNHVYPSTTHRVVNPPGDLARQPRYSVPYFLHPNPDFLIDVLPGLSLPA